MGVVHPIVHLGTKGDDCGIKGIDGILEAELTYRESNLLSEIIQQLVIAFAKE